MTGDMLSQDEIDALLRGEPSPESVDHADETRLNVNDYLSEIEQDAIGEMGNISFGSSATALSTLLNQKVDITTPTVSIIDTARLEEEFPHPYVAVQVKYTTGFSGVNILVIKQSDAAIIADLMLGGDGSSPAQTMEEIHLSAVQEAMNQMMGSAATSMSSVFNKRVDISPPSIELMNLIEGEGTDNFPKQQLLVRVSFRLRIGELIDSEIMQVLPIDFAKKLVSDLMGQSSSEPDLTEPEQSIEEPVANRQTLEQVMEPPQTPPVRQESDQEEVFYHHKEDAKQSLHPSGSTNRTNVQTASFVDFNEQQVKHQDTRNLNMLLDIPLQVTVELGKTKRTVQDILELGSGSILELDKLAGEPVDILVNGRLIANGEVVVIDENFGVRVTDIISQSDRLRKIN